MEINIINLLNLKLTLKMKGFLESYNKTDFLPYSYGLSNVSLYGYPINTGVFLIVVVKKI